MMFCPKCGKKQNNGAIFCYYCGNIIEIPAQDNESMLDNDSDSIDSEDNHREVSADNITENAFAVEEQDEHGDIPELNTDEGRMDEERGIGEEIRCPFCGLWQRKDRTICFKCGKVMRQDDYIDNGNEENDDLGDDIFLTQSFNDDIVPAKEEQRNTTKKKRRKNIKEKSIGTTVLVIIIVSIMVAIFVGALYLLFDSTQRPFESEAMMKRMVKGTYTYYKKGSLTNNAEPYYTLNISDNMVIRRFNPMLDWHGTSDDSKYYITKWDYINRVIETVNEDQHTRGVTIVIEPVEVLSNGNIIFGDNTYKKGGKWESSETVEKKHNQFINSIKSRDETVESAIEITVDKLSPPYDSSYQKCTGTIKNTGINTYKYVKLKGAFKDKYGNVIDTDWTYGVGSEGIAPGESKKFELSVKKDRSIDSCSVSILKDD